MGYHLGFVLQAPWAEEKEGPGHRRLWGSSAEMCVQDQTIEMWLLICLVLGDDCVAQRDRHNSQGLRGQKSIKAAPDLSPGGSRLPPGVPRNLVLWLAQTGKEAGQHYLTGLSPREKL